MEDTMGVGWVSAFFVMSRDGKQGGGGGQWYFMKGRNVTAEKSLSLFSVLL